MIAAIVLAAGRSERMGRPKPLVPVGDGRTFLGAILETMTATRIDEVRVVVGHEADLVVDEGNLVRHVVVHHREYERGMLSSVQAGIRALPPGTSAFFLWPVDLPLVRAETVDALIEAWERDHPPVVVPVHRHKRGHPTLFDGKLVPELMRAPEGEGARAVVHAHDGQLVELAVDDPGVVTQIDTPQAYRRVFGRELGADRSRPGPSARGSRH